MKKFISVIQLMVLMMSYNYCNAQAIIKGSITDGKSGETLVGVSIYLPDLKTGTTTNSDGKYALSGIKPGNYLFEVSLVGYKKLVSRYMITEDTVINFKLNTSVAELNEVVVTGVTRSTELKLSPVAIKPVDMSTLNQNSSTNLIDALKSVPGVNQITTGAGISKPVIRGLGYSRVISLYNGIRQEGQQWGDEHGIEMDEYAIDRVEIVKGPGSLMYGSDGIAGVLNFLTAKPLSEGEHAFRFISNYQSNNQLMGYSVSSGANQKGLQWNTRFSNKFAGNYSNAYDGKIYNSGFREYDGLFGLGVNRKWGYSHNELSIFNSILNMTEGDRDSLGRFLVPGPDGSGSLLWLPATEKDLNGYRIGYPHQLVNHIRTLSNNLFILKGGTLNVDVGFQNNKRKEFGNVLDPTEKNLYFNMNTFTGNFRFNFDQKRGWETTAGVSGMHQSSLNGGVEYLIPEYRINDAGTFIYAQRLLGSRLNFASGIRFDYRSMMSDALYLDSNGLPCQPDDSTATLKFKLLNNDYGNFTGSIGLSLQAGKKSTFKWNFSRGFRSPNIAELTSNGKHEGSFRYEYGSPDLKSEISHQLDFSWSFISDHFVLEISPFINYIHNYIFTARLNSVNGGDSIPDPSDPSPAFRFSQGNAQLNGGEVFIDWHPKGTDWLHFENNFSYVHAIQKGQSDSTRYLPFIPAPRYSGTVRAQFSNLRRSVSNVYFKFGVDHYFNQSEIFSAYGTETKTPAYTLLNAGLGADFKLGPGKSKLECFLTAENLTDFAYQNHLSRLKYAPENPLTGRKGIYDMGRNISLKCILSL